jgi:hypothetical protein
VAPSSCHTSGVRRLALWLISFPLMFAGTELAHALAYRLVYPQASVRWRVLVQTGHSYLGWAPVVLGVGAGLVAAGLASAVVDVARRRESRPLPAWAFASLPIAGFVCQEFLERWLMGGGLPWWMFEQPTFRVGVALQLPFALLAYVAARVLLRVGRTVGRTLVGRSLPALVGARPALRPIASAARRPSVLQRGWSVRGPPLRPV